MEKACGIDKKSVYSLENTLGSRNQPTSGQHLTRISVRDNKKTGVTLNQNVFRRVKYCWQDVSNKLSLQNTDFGFPKQLSLL